MPIYKSYLLLSILLGSISLHAQQINSATIAGEWIGFDNKGQKVTLAFTEQGILQTKSMDKTNSFQYFIKTDAKSSHLLLTPLPGKKTKSKWPFVYDDKDQLQIDFPGIPSILFKRKEENKVKLSRNSINYGDSIIQYTTVISYKKD